MGPPVCLPLSKSLHGPSAVCTCGSCHPLRKPQGLESLMRSCHPFSGQPGLLREHGVFVLSFHRALLVGGRMTITLCIKSGPPG